MQSRILIAEDDRKYVRILEILLGDEGYLLTPTRDGAAAIEALEHGDFDAVLTDLQMPKADGLAVLARVRELDPDLPVVGISLEALERTLLEQALARTGGNKAQAAALLGLTRNTLRYRLEKHGL